MAMLAGLEYGPHAPHALLCTKVEVTNLELDERSTHLGVACRGPKPGQSPAELQ